MDFERNQRQFKEINLTALIDIVFHLMVFVMLTTSFVVSESMELALPANKTEATAAAPGVMRVQVISDGTVWVDGAIITLAQFNALLAERIGNDPATRIAIYTTPGASVQQLVAVMDAVYLTGGRNVQVDKAG